MDIVLLSILIILGASVLFTYYYVFTKRMTPAPYLTHELWLGMPKSTVIVLVIFQVLAAIGFMLGSISWVISPPVGGIMGSSVSRNVIFALVLIASILWPLSVMWKIPALVVGSLVVVAFCAILICAGSVEEYNSRWYVVLGFLLFAITVVLSDGVLWNAKYISQL